MKQIKLKFGDTLEELFSPVLFKYLDLLDKKPEAQGSSMWRDFKQSMLEAGKTLPEVLGMVVEGIYSERHSVRLYNEAFIKAHSVTSFADARMVLTAITLNGAVWEYFKDNTGIKLNKLYYCLIDYPIV